MSFKKKPPYNLKTKIVSALRKIWRYHPMKREVLKKNIHTRRSREQDHTYQCEECGFIGVKQEFDVDHIEPVVDVQEGFVDWNTYINRMFCNINNLKLLCKTCHTNKTNEEKKNRALNKKRVDKNVTYEVEYSHAKSKNIRSAKSPRQIGKPDKRVPKLKQRGSNFRKPRH